MMSIRFQCPKCRKVLRAPEGSGGKRAECPACKAILMIPPVVSGRERPASLRDAVPENWTSEPRRVVVATPQGDIEREITYYCNTIGMEFVLIPAGEFMMGSPEHEEGRFDDEGPVHKVRVAKPFFLGATSVTQGAYEQVVGRNPSEFRGPKGPVEQVSWYDAQEFIKLLCGMEGLSARAYRLPTEAEWEYACRAGSRTRFYSGDADTALWRIGWCDDNSVGGTHEVARKPPNAFGLYDMSGNVFDWCQSVARDYPYSGSDGRDDLSCSGPRIMRGGAWDYIDRACRSAHRCRRDPTEPFSSYGGFRVAMSSPPQD